METVKILGQGSYGIVSLVRINPFPGCNYLVAKKSSSLISFRNLQKELRILLQLRGCPGIVRCCRNQLEIETVRDVPFCSLYIEFALGGTLSDLMRINGGKLPEQQVKQYARMILQGLYCMHAKGYVHCDLKPDNVLAFPSRSSSSSWELKISDFGLAKEPWEASVMMTPGFRGTPFYMSPESVGLGGAIGPALDIWSLGCCVLEMVKGTAAWTRDRWTLPGDMSLIGKDFLKRCLASNPAERWTAQMLLRHPFVLEAHEMDRMMQRQNILPRRCDERSRDSFKNNGFARGYV